MVPTTMSVGYWGIVKRYHIGGKMGYKKIRIGDRLIDEHRLIMERHLGRELEVNEIVHHKDGDKSNNDLENLEVMSRSEHSRSHKLGNSMPIEVREKISATKTGKVHKNSRKVKQVDIETDRELRIFNSTMEASRNLLKANADAHIRDCCNGKRKTAYGYKWKWL